MKKIRNIFLVFFGSFINKLSFFMKVPNYIYIITRSDDINYFMIDNFEGVDKRQMMVTLDLEILYLKKTLIPNGKQFEHQVILI